MESFIALNKKKIPYMFAMIAAILIAFILLVLLIVWLVNDDSPGIEGISIIILMAGFPMPAFLLVIGYIGWYFDRRIRVKILSKKPFNCLHEIGFVSTYIDADTNFTFTEETLGATMLGYEVQFNVERGAPKKIHFTVFVQHNSLSKDSYKRLDVQLEKEDVYFNFDGLIKKYDHRKVSDLTIQHLEMELKLLIEKLKTEGFEPRTN